MKFRSLVPRWRQLAASANVAFEAIIAYIDSPVTPFAAAHALAPARLGESQSGDS